MHSILQHSRSFARRHDDIPAFHAASIALTLLAAALFNVGAFAVLIVAHAALDIIKYRDVHGMPWLRTLSAIFREGLLDLFFLSVALCFALTLHHGQSVFALSGAIRMEEVLLRVFGMGLARLEVLMHSMWIFSNIRQHLVDVRDATGAWRWTELLVCCGFIGSVSIIAASPLVMGSNAVITVLTDQLVPWRI